jgi:hypothetical protein
MVVNRRSVLSGTLAVGGLVVSGCHSKPAGPAEDEPVVPWPAGDTLGIGLEGYPYPHAICALGMATGFSGFLRRQTSAVATTSLDEP